jgi:hypothetical protein
VPRVLHDTDPTTKTGLDQIQNTDRWPSSNWLAARPRASLRRRLLVVHPTPAPGRHELKFRSANVNGFTLNVNYHLIVA